ncbi:MAG: DUF2723 domain-containing protein [Bacteroidales bacterium]|nr:DUF2723 domain-containing protein [Bacteroidales bacterium]
MQKFKIIDRITGWCVFLIATISYLLTIEPTASYWDCGEFICTAFRLEVGHPPGAPLFMILGRVFSLLAGDNVENVPVMINAMSAIASGLTILFLYWSITHIGRRIVQSGSDGREFSVFHTLSVIGSGVVGSLAFAYTDTFWFSAVEGEVYAMSSLFTAVVFWCILKWEDEASQKYSSRWLVLICYLMGLSIGVHLLNLLVIPAIVFVYYFKKYTTSAKGVVYAFLISCVILAGILYGIIPGVVWLASIFELVFTNGMGAPYNTGTIIYVVLLLSGLVYGLYYSYTHRKVVLNTVLLCVSVILIGYSSFAMIVIRSAANPPMDENNPDNVFALQSYLNREQYGDRPLITGEYFNSELDHYENTSPTYIQRNGRYEIVDYKSARVYKPGTTTLFPRMYSPEPSHVQGYVKWAGITDQRVKPSFVENLTFFFSYQLNYMYWRYFLWNFAGRQNDLQGHDGHLVNGNWISGIPAIDNYRLGNQDLLSDAIRNNKGNNRYFFLPLILGIIGMIYLLRAGKLGKQYFWVVFLFFFLTGIAIVVYLNQTPYQPRERDYAYAGSFYAFAIYIGLALAGFCRLIEKRLGSSMAAAALASVASLMAGPVILAAQNWDDHDRSNRYTARDFARNYLESCAPNAILFTNGDNDTFPLWYAQEVEGIRTDIRVVNLAYINTDWYINQMRRQAYLSAPLPISIEKEKLVEGSRDIVYFNDMPSMFFNEKYEGCRQRYAPVLDSMHTDLVNVIKSSNFRNVMPGDYDAVVNNNQLKGQPVAMAKFATSLAQQPDKYGINPQHINIAKQNLENLRKAVSKEPVPLLNIVDFVASDNESSKATMQNGEKVDYVPSLDFSIPVDKQKVLDNGTVSPEDADKIVDRLVWKHPRSYIRKGELMVLDILAHNNWERPVYFAITVGADAFQGLDSYFRLDGLAYRVVPIKSTPQAGDRGYVNSQILYDAYVNKFTWGGIDNPDVYMDENNNRMLMNIKSGFFRLAESLLRDKNTEKAVEVLDYSYKVMPMGIVAPSYYDVFLANLYYKAGSKDKARDIYDAFGAQTIKDMKYMVSLSSDQTNMVGDDYYRIMALAHELVRSIRENKDSDYDLKYSTEFANILQNVDFLQNVSPKDLEGPDFYQIYQRLGDLEKQVAQIYMFFVLGNIK